MSALKIGWFTSGGGKASRDLLIAVETAVRRKEIDAEIEFVFCTRGPGEYIESNLLFRLVNVMGHTFVSVPYQRYKSEHGQQKAWHGELPAWRSEYDRAVMRALSPFHPDICVLAGYMLVAGPELCMRYDMINLHPAYPGGPAGTWRQVVWQLIERKAVSGGSMMHLVTPELDKGPPVSCCTFPIRGENFDRLWGETKGKTVGQLQKEQGEETPLFRAIREAELAREIPLVVATLKAMASGQVKISADKRVVDRNGKPTPALDLTEEMEAQLRKK